MGQKVTFHLTVYLLDETRLGEWNVNPYQEIMTCTYTMDTIGLIPRIGEEVTFPIEPEEFNRMRVEGITHKVVYGRRDPEQTVMEGSGGTWGVCMGRGRFGINDPYTVDINLEPIRVREEDQMTLQTSLTKVGWEVVVSQGDTRCPACGSPEWHPHGTIAVRWLCNDCGLVRKDGHE